MICMIWVHSLLDVCLLRLDFENFNIIGAGGTAIDNEGDCMDTFTVTVFSLAHLFH